MVPRWWRIGLIVEREGDPWTWTFHVRAPTEKQALALVAGHLGREPYRIYECHKSEPLLKAPRTPEIAAHFGPFRRSRSDPLLGGTKGSDPVVPLLEEDEGA